MTELDYAHDTLNAARDIISTDRMSQYGHPAVNFERIAGMWDSFLIEKLNDDEHITATDVAALLIMVKLSRIANDPSKLDSWVDLVGYGALGAEVIP